MKNSIKLSRMKKVWASINQQCYNEKRPNYKYYGGKGIKVEWLTFDEFYADMGKSFKEGLFLSRIDKNANYSVDNCVWGNRLELHKNKCNQHLLTIDGVTKKASDWARENNIKPTILLNRSNSGYCQDNILQANHGKGNYITIGGKTQIIADWCRELNVSYDNVRSRRRVSKWSTIKSLITPIREHKQSNAQAYSALMIEKDGIKDSLSGWCKRLDLSINTIYYRMKRHNIGVTKALFGFEKFSREVV
jgi:hypothetical protein